MPLEDEADRLAHLDEVVLAQAAQRAVRPVLAVPDLDVALLERAQAAQQGEQRRLAAARRAAEDDDLAGHHFQVDVHEDGRPRLAGAEGVVDFDEPDDRLTRRRQQEGVGISVSCQSTVVREFRLSDALSSLPPVSLLTTDN